MEKAAESVMRPKLRQRVRTWVRNHGLALEALLAVAVARLCVALCFAQVAGWALRERPLSKRAAPERAVAPELKQRVAQRVGTRVEAAAHRLPGESKCLANAMAAKWMLARRGFGSTIHLGFGFREDGGPHAHAWLEAAGMVITGEQQRPGVTHLPR